MFGQSRPDEKCSVPATGARKTKRPRGILFETAERHDLGVDGLR
jgi:hypothetical protein